MGVKERKAETLLDKEIQKMGGITRKWVNPFHIGVTDRIVIVPMIPFTIFVETKSADGRLSAVQVREHRRLEMHGATVFTVYGEVGVLRLIEELNMAKKLWDSADSPLRAIYTYLRHLDREMR